MEQVPYIWTSERLDGFRRQADPAADAVIAAMVAQGDAGGVSRMLTRLLSNGTEQQTGAQLPPEVTSFLEATMPLPPWADRAKIATAELLFLDQGPLILLALTCASLPECYINGKESQILGVSNRLKGKRAYRRIYETAQLIVDVLSPGGLTTATGAGIAAAQRVRLLHASMRHFILRGRQSIRRPSDEALIEQLAQSGFPQGPELPINQEDLAYTLCTFSYVVLRALTSLGVPIEPGQQDAYVHCWAVVGHVMGIHDELIPRDFAQAEALFGQIRGRQMKSTKEEKALAKSLWTFMGKVLGFPWIGRRVGILLMRTFLDHETLSGLGIGSMNILDQLIALLFRLFVRNVEEVQQNVARTDLRPLLRWSERRIIDRLCAMPPAWEGRLFAIGPALRGHWEAQRRKRSP